MITIKNLQLNLPGFSLGPLSLEVDNGAFFTLMGPTGSGKTLLLEILAGLTRPHAGEICFAGKTVTRAQPEKRNIGLVYQDHALFPHLTVLDNITYGQRYHFQDRAKGLAFARDLMDMLGLTPLIKRRPATLSGGEKQRVALARALACKPSLMLLDEPLSSLDPQFREGLRKNLKELHRGTGTTFFMVTHDFVDALALADSAAVIRKGRIEQCGPTLDIFHRPATTFIADFVGMKNILAAEYANGLCNLDRPGSCPASLPARDTPDGKGFTALRPEDLHVSLNGGFPGHWVSLPGTVLSISRQGFSWLATVQCNGMDFVARLEHRLVLENTMDEGSSVTLGFDPASAHHIPGDRG